MLPSKDMHVEGCLSKAKPFENPLVPNKKLKQLYAAMVEARVLDEFALRTAGKVRSGRLKSTRGQEACRVSTAMNLAGGDLVCDAGDGVVMRRIAGASVGSVLARLDAIRSGAKKRAAAPRGRSNAAQVLPWIADAGDRLRMALGAALSVKMLGHANLVVVYVDGRELPDAVWRRVLGLAAEFELPIIFVALPQAAGERGGRSMSAKALASGVPGFPVDAGDAVALYRVAQESIARARGNGGPALIECLTRLPLSEQNAGLNDPIVQMRGFMLGRKVAGKAWLDGVGRAFRSKLDAAAKRSQTRAGGI